MTFEELGVNGNILSAIKELNFVNPMPVQAEVIPFLFENQNSDLVALAQTGTGKTAAFGIPLIQNTNTNQNTVQHLILSPTRELCLQITDDIIDYSKNVDGLKVVAVYGGASIDRQIKVIKKGVHIISATPGRLLDLIKRKVVKLSKVKTVVLDEADEMLNMGFREELEAILSTTPDTKSTYLFSATMPKSVQSIAKNYMSNPHEITIGKRNAGSENVQHICYMVHARDRYLALKRIADYFPEIYGIIFCRTRRETQEVADLLIKDGYNADALHGDLSQAQRDVVMNKFRIRHLRLLVATDVAARGLDVDDLTHVINYNLPDESEIYTHRSGRTGRAGKFGTSIIIANLKEKSKIRHIEKIINKKIDNLEIPNGNEICEKQLFHLIDRMEKVEIDDSEINSYLPQIYKKLEMLDRDELIKKFVSVEFNRFLDYYKNADELIAPTDRSKSRKERGERGSRDDGKMTRFFINLGKTDNLKPTNLIGLINDLTNVRNIEIGEIDIMKNFSFFEADSEYASLLIKSFNNGQYYKKREIVLEVAEKKKAKQNSGSGGRRMKQGRASSRKNNKSQGNRSSSRRKKVDLN